MKTTKSRSIKTLLALEVTVLNQEEIAKVMQYKIKQHSQVFHQAYTGKITSEEAMQFIQNVNAEMKALNDWFVALENAKDKSFDELISHFN
jgi:hypothetical protein